MYPLISTTPLPSQAPSVVRTAKSVSTSCLRETLDTLNSELQEERRVRQAAETEIRNTRKQLEKMEKLLSLRR